MLSIDTMNAFPGAQMMPLNFDAQAASGQVFPVPTSLLNQSTQSPNAMQFMVTSPFQQLQQQKQFIFQQQPQQQQQQQMFWLNQYQQQLFNNGAYKLPQQTLQLMQPQFIQQHQTPVKTLHSTSLNKLSKLHEKKTVESDKPQFDKELRAVILKRYRDKRKRRNFRRVRYGLRKQIAHGRPRVGGRFVKKGSLPPTPTTTSTSTA